MKYLEERLKKLVKEENLGSNCMGTLLYLFGFIGKDKKVPKFEFSSYLKYFYQVDSIKFADIICWYAKTENGKVCVHTALIDDKRKLMHREKSGGKFIETDSFERLNNKYKNYEFIFYRTKF